MRVLLIAPDHNGQQLNYMPEVRSITELHTCFVLADEVKAQDVFDAASRREYDVIHFATHVDEGGMNDLDRLVLSSDSFLTLHDVSQIARMANAQLVFFNVCLTQRFATYVTRQGVPASIHANVMIEDSEAWKLPQMFYAQVAKLEEAHREVDFKAVLERVDGGNALYGIKTNGRYFRGLLDPVERRLDAVERQLSLIALSLESYGVEIKEEHPGRHRVVQYILFGVMAILLIWILLTQGVGA